MKIQVPLSPWEETTPARCSEMPTPKDFCSFTPFRSSRNVENEYNSPAKYSETKARTPLSDLGSNANVRPTAVAASPAKRPIVLTPHPSKDRVQLVMNVEESAGVDTSEADALRERVACLEAQLADAMAQLAKTIAPVSLAIHVVEPVDESSKQEAEDLRAQVAALKREAHQLREQAAAATAAKANVEELLEQERAAAAAAAANTPPASRAAINTLRTQLQDTQDAKSQLEAKILKMEEAAQARADEHAALLEYLTLERQAEADERDEAERRLQHAQQAAVQWEDLARQYDTDRTAVAENVAKAEREVDLLAEENTALFRQINYLRSKLVANMAALDHAVPVVGRLARDLSAWCEKEGVARGGAGVGGSLGAGLSASMAGGAIGKSSMLGAPGTTMKTPGSKSFSRTLPRSVMRRNH